MKKSNAMIGVLLIGCLLSVYISVEAGQVDDVQSVSAGDAGIDVEETYNSDYYNALIAQEIKELEYTIYSSQIKARLCDHQIAYLTDTQAVLEEKYKIEKAKLDLGYSTPVMVEEAKNQSLEVAFQIETVREQQELLKDILVLYGGEYEGTNSEKELTPLKDDYLSAFIANSAQLVYYNQQIQLAKDNQATTVLLLQKEQYQINLEIYVRSLQMQYHDMERQTVILDNEIAVMESKLANATALLERGKIAEIQLRELEVELSRLQYERLRLVCDAQMIYYILTNTIEGQEI